ncbi:MAG: hypothetical protein JWM33_3403 [Caulobacteraceae bacterium]|nr:hypothetical protein [Caulobacteraceae bacterium]
MIEASDELHLRSGLPAEFRYLEAACPRANWAAMKLHPTADHWLEIHAWFRGMMQDLVELGADWREGRVAAPAYRVAAIPRLRQLLGNLHGHHHHESENYFPALAALEPDMAKGFALLDRDHDAIELLLSEMAQAGTALNQAAAQAGDLRPHAGTLTAAIERGGFLIGRHLTDEEEIIVPVLTLRGDPLR